MNFFAVSALLVYLYHEDKVAIVASHKENIFFHEDHFGHALAYHVASIVVFVRGWPESLVSQLCSCDSNPCPTFPNIDRYIQINIDKDAM